MLTNEKKRQIFLSLRSDNYRASLRLEGLVPLPAGAHPANAPVTVVAPSLKIRRGR